MNVKQLISKLQKLDQDRDVVLEGYEGGYCDVRDVSVVTIDKDVNQKDFLGPHEDGTTEQVYLITRIFYVEK